MTDKNKLKNGAKAHRLTAEDRSRGGKRSAEVRKETKTLQKAVIGMLQTQIRDVKAMKRLAKEMGVADEEAIMELVTVAGLVNTIKQGGADSLAKLCQITGDITGTESEINIKVKIDE